MNRAAYLDAVAAELRGLTDYEKAAVRRELDGHIEDHAEALRVLGCSEEEADTRATERMGDPVETGRGIAALYRPFWLWVERVAGVLIAVMALELLLGIGLLQHTTNSIRARFYHSDNATVVSMDERMEIGDDVLRLYGVRRYQEGAESGVELNDKILQSLTVTANGEGRTYYAAEGGGWSGATAFYLCLRVPLEAGDTSLTLHYTRFGTVAEHTVDLAEVLA